MTNPHTPCGPVPRDESNQTALDDMAECGDWFWGSLAALAVAVFIAWKGGWL